MVALAVASRFIPTMSFALTVVVVNAVKVVECNAVPLAIDRNPPVKMVLDTVGIAVPVAIFHTSKLTVPVSTRMLYAAIVQANGTVT